MKRRINKDGKAERDCFQRRVIKVFLTACHFCLYIGRASRLIHNMVNPLHSCDTKIIPLSPSCLQGLYSTACIPLDLLFDLLIDPASIWQQRALHSAAMITRTNFLLFFFLLFSRGEYLGLKLEFWFIWSLASLGRKENHFRGKLFYKTKWANSTSAALHGRIQTSFRLNEELWKELLQARLFEISSDMLYFWTCYWLPCHCWTPFLVSRICTWPVDLCVCCIRR